MRLTVSQMTTAFTYLSLLRALPEDVDIPEHYLLAKIAKNTSLPNTPPLDQESKALIPSLYHTAKNVINYTAHKPLMHLALSLESFIRNERGSVEALSKQNRVNLEKLGQEYQEQLQQFAPLITLLQQIKKASIQTTDQLILEIAVFSTPSSSIEALDLNGLSSSATRKELFLVQKAVEKIFEAPRTLQRIKINCQRLEKGKQELIDLASNLAKITLELEEKMHTLEELMLTAKLLNTEKTQALLTLEEEAHLYLLSSSHFPSS
ncbi:MAG: hypothetical protein QRY71_05870 [Candidatus Rhabdochlamydia sp.]